MLLPRHHQFVQPLPVVTLALGYKPPSRSKRRAAIYGKHGQKEMRHRGLYASKPTSDNQ